MDKSKEEKNTSLIIANMEKTAVKLFFAVGFLLFAAVGFPNMAKAANFYFSPVSGSYEVGKSFSVSVFVSSSDQAMNATDGVISFSSDKLEITSLSKNGSILSLWVLEPSFSNSAGTINFEGVVMNPGFTGANGKIITINFKTKDVGQATLNFSSGSVLANDGEGTNILTSLGSAKFDITSPAPKEPAPSPEREEIPAEEEVSKPQISSPTHPDQTVWYSNSTAKFKWEIPYGITGVSILLDDNITSDPGPVSDGLFSTRDYEDLEDGVWYLHLKLKNQAGWSEIGNFKVQVDINPPLPFKIEIGAKEGVVGQVLSFEAIDATSGIDRYEVKIGSQDFVVKSENDYLKVPSLPSGKYTVIVKAIDKAGNETLAFTDFTIEPTEAPVIRNYPRELRSTDQLFMLGTALPNVTIDVSIQNKKTEEIIKQTVESDKNGNWNLVYKGRLDNGKYFAWAEAINSQGIRSESSNKISFLVTSPIFVKFGSWAINYFTIFILLLILLILIVSFLAYWAGLIRGRLKKETDEIQQVLHGNLKEFRKLIEMESAYLAKLKGKVGYAKERARMNKVLKGRVDFVEKKVTKEIKDVQDLLK